MIKIKGGLLQPVQHQDGDPLPHQDRVYGVAADGSYLGLVDASIAPQAADRAPPTHGAWRWDGAAWTAYRTPEQRAADIELERDARLAAGFELNGLRFYSDETFANQVTSLLACYTNGIVAADSTIEIRTMDKVVRKFTRDHLTMIAAALLDYVNGVWRWSWSEKAKIGD